MQTQTKPLQQQGSVLLEVMIAILIFSFGLLAIMGLQAASIVNLSEAKYRNEASFYANRLIGDMWTSDRRTLAANFATGTARYNAWYAGMQNTNAATGLLGLPGADVLPPTVAVATVLNGALEPTSFNVTVTVNWQAPGQTAHRHVAFASLTRD
jgi:type IV pilus assembly protein PilV